MTKTMSSVSNRCKFSHGFNLATLQFCGSKIHQLKIFTKTLTYAILIFWGLIMLKFPPTNMLILEGTLRTRHLTCIQDRE